MQIEWQNNWKTLSKTAIKYKKKKKTEEKLSKWRVRLVNPRGGGRVRKESVAKGKADEEKSTRI